MTVSFGRKLAGLALGVAASAALPSAASATFSINTDVSGGYTNIGSLGGVNGWLTIGSTVEAAGIGQILLRGQASDKPLGQLTDMPVWCIDVSSWLKPGTFVEQPLSFITNPGGAGHVGYSSTQLNNALKFLIYATGQGINNSTSSAATQLGLWEILNESTASWSLGAGNFKVSEWGGSSATAMATTWLNTTAASLSTISTTNYSLAILDPGCPLGTCNQTQAYLRYAPGPVPEPASWLTMILGFGAIGSAVRRRRAVGRAVA